MVKARFMIIFFNFMLLTNLLLDIFVQRFGMLNLLGIKARELLPNQNGQS